MTQRSICSENPASALFRIFGAVVIALGLLLNGATGAKAQAMCLRHSDLAAQLETKFGEAPTAIALASNGGLIELFSTGDGATWTLVMTSPDGVACVLVSGESWDRRHQVAKGPVV